MNVSVRAHAGHGADPAGDQVEQLLVAGADHLAQHVVGAGGHHHVDRPPPWPTSASATGCDGAVDVDPDHRLAAEAELQRVGDRDDLHDAGVGEPLHPLAHGGLGEPDRLADRGVGAAAVLLQLLDDRLGDVVEHVVCPRPGGDLSAMPVIVVAGHGAWQALAAATDAVNRVVSASDLTVPWHSTCRDNGIPCPVPALACKGEPAHARSPGGRRRQGTRSYGRGQGPSQTHVAQGGGRRGIRDRQPRRAPAVRHPVGEAGPGGVQGHGPLGRARS